MSWEKGARYSNLSTCIEICLVHAGEEKKETFEVRDSKIEPV